MVPGLVSFAFYRVFPFPAQVGFSYPRGFLHTGHSHSHQISSHLSTFTSSTPLKPDHPFSQSHPHDIYPRPLWQFWGLNAVFALSYTPNPFYIFHFVIGSHWVTKVIIFTMCTTPSDYPLLKWPKNHLCYGPMCTCISFFFLDWSQWFQSLHLIHISDPYKAQ